MPSRCIMVVLLLQLTVAVASAVTPNDQLTVLTYNIHHGRGNDNQVDLERIARVIQESKADLVAVQEVDNQTTRTGKVDQLATLAERTGMYAAFGKAIEFGGGSYGVGVLSRYPITQRRVHQLPGTQGSEQRVALEVQTQLADQSSVTFVATHLDHQHPEDRQAQMRRLNELFANRRDTPIILAGDLNALRSSDELHVLLEHWRPASLKTPAPTFPAQKPSRQIDYVMLRKNDAWNVERTQVLHYPVASDHAPLLVKLSPVNEPNTAASDVLNNAVAKGQKIDQRSEAWNKERQVILRAMQSMMGPLPGDERRCDLDIHLEASVPHEDYTQQLITYQSEPGSRVPAYLLIPHAAQEPNAQLRAALCLHPTDNRIGHQVVVGLGGKPGRQYARELAQRGFVTLAPAYPQLANYQPDLKMLGYTSGTMKAIWDNMRAIDLLESLPYTTKDGVAAIGHSLGGHNAIYTAAFDTRIKVVVSSCGFDSYQDYKDGDIRGWTSSRYMPRMLDYAHRLHQLPFDFQHILVALAPRPCLVSAPVGDSNFGWKSVDDVAALALPIYDLMGKREQLVIVHPDCGHDFPEDVRQQAYEFIEESLRQASSQN